MFTAPPGIVSDNRFTAAMTFCEICSSVIPLCATGTVLDNTISSIWHMSIKKNHIANGDGCQSRNTTEMAVNQILQLMGLLSLKEYT